MRGEFTGRHMLICILGFFATIVTVNLVMATLANRSWSGLVVANSYVASQTFDERMIEHEARNALGWRGTLDVSVGGVALQFRDADGTLVRADQASVTLRRPTHERDDLTLTLEPDVYGFAARRPIAPGIWLAEVTAMRGGAIAYLRSFRVLVDKTGGGG